MYSFVFVASILTYQLFSAFFASSSNFVIFSPFYLGPKTICFWFVWFEFFFFVNRFFFLVIFSLLIFFDQIWFSVKCVFSLFSISFCFFYFLPDWPTNWAKWCIDRMPFNHTGADAKFSAFFCYSTLGVIFFLFVWIFCFQIEK